MDSSNNLNMAWWDQGGDDRVHRDQMAHDLKRVYDHLLEADRYRLELNLHHQRLYGNQPVSGVNPRAYDRHIEDDSSLRLNAIGSYCDLATARIGKLRPAAKLLPMGGDASLTRRAELLERFVKAQFRVSKVYAATRKAFLDSTVFGTGCLKSFANGDEIVVERVFPSEIFIDPLESLYGKPQMAIQRKWVSKAVLKAEFHDRVPKTNKKERARLKRVIADSTIGADLGDQDSKAVEESVGDQVLVLEGWHLPSSPEAKDGKRVVCTDAGWLLVEDWEKDHLPLRFIRWGERLRGFWGKGIAEMLNGVQVEINMLLLKIQEAQERFGQTFVFADARSNFEGNSFTTEIGRVFKYMGKEPKAVMFPAIAPEVYTHLDRLWLRAGELVGFSQDAVSPGTQGISGVSAETQHEIGSERFVIQGQGFEDLHLELAEDIIELAAEIGKRNPNFALPALEDRKTISKIAWKDVNMKRDQYVIQVLPVSSLPDLPGPRQTRVAALMDMGVVDADTAAELLQMPDLEKYLDLAMGARRSIERALDNIVGEGVYEPPEPLDDLRLAMMLGNQHYHRAKNNGVEEERLEMLRLYMNEAHEMLQAAQVEQMKLAAAEAAQGELASPAAGAPPAPGPGGQSPMAAPDGPAPQGL